MPTKTKQGVTSLARPTPSEADRFWAKVEKSAGCWLWTGSRLKGYGRFWLGGAPRLAHRVSYAWTHGPIPDGMQVDHICHNPACVNPNHLRLATNSHNAQNRSGANKNSKSGFRGVCWNASKGVWVAHGGRDGRQVEVGRFDNLEEAAAAIAAWRKENMPYSTNDQKEF